VGRRAARVGPVGLESPCGAAIACVRSWLPMDLGLTGRCALVTGGSRGIGLAAARVLVAEGANVALLARTREPLERAARELRAHSGRTVASVVADTGEDESVLAAVRTVVEQLGAVDILVNAAATPATGAPLREEDLEHEINIKVRGYLRCVRAVAPMMVERGWGRIINVSGLAARQTGSITGSIRNVAVAAMTKNLAEELGPKGVNVTVVHPGMTITETSAARFRALAAATGRNEEAIEADIASRVSIGRTVRAEEVADVIAFLASPRSIALNGDAIIASGGARGAIHY
jgi:NAD(P)-dependent dehydrogenase (short-subunit alcohol dehydrogenase family)